MVIEEKLEISLLLDYYREMLGEPQRNIMMLRFNEDLSLAEIAEREGISRQGVRDYILRGTKLLYSYEDKLKLKHRFNNLRDKLDKLRAKASSNQELVNDIDHIIEGLEDINGII